MIDRRTLLVTATAAIAGARGAAAATSGTVLITGANRGLGLEFTKQYAARGWNVIATTRNPDDAAALNAVAAKNGKVAVERLDVTKGAEVDALAAKYKGRPIDILINNAGISGDFRNPKPQSFGSLDFGMADDFLQVNAVAPLKVTEAFYENVKASPQKKIAAVTSLVSVHAGNYGNVTGSYWYKISKAALNASMANIANDAKKDGVTVVLLSPGTVRVEKIASASFPGLIEMPESIGGMIKVLDGVTLADTGSIIRYTGERMPF